MDLPGNLTCRRVVERHPIEDRADLRREFEGGVKTPTPMEMETIVAYMQKHAR